MKKVSLTEKELNRILRLLENRQKTLPYRIQERKERYSNGGINLACGISFGSKDDEATFEHNKEMIIKMERNLIIETELLKKLV